jgi:hypothetical protein
MASLQPSVPCHLVAGYTDPDFNQDAMVGITAAERLKMQQWLQCQALISSEQTIEAPSEPSQPSLQIEMEHASGAELMQSTPAPPQPSQIPLVETLMACIDVYQFGQANESTYICAANALRDLHAFVQTSEQCQRAPRRSGVIIIIEGEEFTLRDYRNERIAVRSSDSAAFNSSTGDCIGLWNEDRASVTRHVGLEVGVAGIYEGDDL